MTAPRAFVIGWPIRHSRSPVIHGHWLKTYGLAGSYEAVPVEPAALAGFLASLAANGFVGGNVTVPHKEGAFAAADRADEIATRLGAANTLWLEDGRLCASNTDGYGFLANLDAGQPGWDDVKGPAVVLGAGGAARAIVHALAARGLAPIRIANRTLTRVDDFKARFGPTIEAVSWENRSAALEDARLLVNTTSLGMAGEPDVDIDLSRLPADALVTDIVYVPLETGLLRAARQRGNPVVDGLGMLLHQAVPGFERWFGLRPEVTDELRAVVLAHIGSS
ncbi:MAG TPA: shikimate dehydrogenase [Kaistiaceae bacterium]|nr:shikimate dehydrogenase [Kaistiaceae bacterium]